MTKAERMNAVYAAFTAYMADAGIEYTAEEKKRTLAVGFVAARPVCLCLTFETAYERVFLHADLPVEVRETARLPLGLACNAINRLVAAGTFAYDANNDRLRFAYNATVAGVESFAPLFAEQVLSSALTAIDTFLPRLMGINDGTYTLDELDAFLREEEEAL